VASIDHQVELSRAGANIRGPLGGIAFFIRRYPLGAAGGLIVAAFVLIAIFAPLITTFDPTSTNPRSSLAAPGSANILGADFMGRDMWSRIVYGARISLAVGIGSTAPAAGTTCSCSASSTSCSRCRCW
jgi:peptide/nickel transport system permease protein